MARGERASSTRRAFQKLKPHPAASVKQDLSNELALTLEEPAVAAARELWLALCEPGDKNQKKLLDIARDFSSQVSVESPDGVLLEAGRSRLFFGGLKSLLARLQARCQQASLEPRWGLAPTPLAALVLARAVSGRVVLQRARLVSALAPLPLAALGWPMRTLERLTAIGVREIGAALRLPRAEFARRYGRECLESLDRLVGRRADLRRAWQPPLRFYLHRQLDFELRSTDLILRELQPMLQALEQFLRRHQFALERLQLQLDHRERPEQGIPASTVLRASLAQPSAQAAPFARWFAERLARERLPATVTRLQLRSGALRPLQVTTESLWRPGEHGGALGRESPALIERLRARLGSDAVYGLCLVDEHRPEYAYRVAEPTLGEPYKTAEQKIQKPKNQELKNQELKNTESKIFEYATVSEMPRRPLWLLHEPQPLPWPWQALQWLCGPERIETGWWDGREVMRDYYHALDPQGAEIWVFRERQPPHGWYLHGVFG